MRGGKKLLSGTLARLVGQQRLDHAPFEVDQVTSSHATAQPYQSLANIKAVSRHVDRVADVRRCRKYTGLTLQPTPARSPLLALFILVLGLAPVSASSLKLPDIRRGLPKGPPIIAPEYRGRWCLKQRAGGYSKDLSEIRISARKLHIYGEDEQAQRVSKRAGRAMIVLFVKDAEGTVFDAERQFSLSAGGSELRLRSEDEDDSTLYTRCPR